MSDSIKKNIKADATWVRALFMVLFAIAYGLAEMLVVAIAVFQFLSKLISGSVNKRLLAFGNSLSQYIYEIMLFLTFNSEKRPYPVTEWPKPRDLPEKKSTDEASKE